MRLLALLSFILICSDDGDVLDNDFGDDLVSFGEAVPATANLPQKLDCLIIK